MDVHFYLNTKIQQAFSEEWDPRRPTRVEVTGEGAEAGLCFFAQRRDGSWSVVHEEPPVALTTNQDVDELLARALSMFLMKHPSWLR